MDDATEELVSWFVISVRLQPMIVAFDPELITESEPYTNNQV